MRVCVLWRTPRTRTRTCALAQVSTERRGDLLAASNFGRYVNRREVILETTIKKPGDYTLFFSTEAPNVLIRYRVLSFALNPAGAKVELLNFPPNAGAAAGAPAPTNGTAAAAAAAGASATAAEPPGLGASPGSAPAPATAPAAAPAPAAAAAAATTATTTPAVAAAPSPAQASAVAAAVV